jgi:predicted RND superfamily exporter protein
VPEPRQTFSLIPGLLARRRLALALIALLTVVLGWRALTLRIDPEVESMIPTGRGDLDALRTFHARFGSDEVVVIALHSDRLFSRESLERIDRLTQRVKALPHVVQL